MTRRSSIDIIKFVFSIIIVLYHIGFKFFGGYIVVDGFFMITGYLMMASLCRSKEEDLLKPDSTARFALHKYSSIFFPLLFSAIIGFLVYDDLIYENFDRTIGTAQFTRILFEVFPLQTAGMDGYWATGVSWYLSAMLIAVIILHICAKKDPERFGWSVGPLLTVLSYGLICAKIGHLDAPNIWLGFLNSGLLRAIGGMSAGFVLYLLVKRSSKKINPVMRGVYTLLEVGGWYAIIRALTIVSEWDPAAGKYSRSPFDFIVLAIVFCMLYLALSGKTVLALIGDHKITGMLATASTYIFLNHYYWSQYIRKKAPDVPVYKLLPTYFILVITSAFGVWALTKLSRFVVRKAKERIRRAKENGSEA